MARCPAAVRDVEVLGSVSGFGSEDKFFDIPHTIDLGAFDPESGASFTMIVDVPAQTEIVCSTPGLTFEPKSIPAGRSEVKIVVSGMSSMTFLYAEVLFKSMFTRRVYVSGRPSAAAEKADGRLVYEARERAPEPEASPAPQENTQAQSVLLTDVISVNAPAPLYDMPLLDMRKGQRVALYQYIGSACEVSFTCMKPEGIDIDPYVFLLDGNERSFGDRGLVFFGNESSEKGEVRYFPEDGHIEIDFSKVDYRVQKITLAYSVYAGDATKNFSKIRAPRISVFANGAERIAFDMTGLADETTVVAAEFYQYKGEWRISAVGAGFRDGMARLCNRYGIEVTD